MRWHAAVTRRGGAAGTAAWLGQGGARGGRCRGRRGRGGARRPAPVRARGPAPGDGQPGDADREQRAHARREVAARGADQLEY